MEIEARLARLEAAAAAADRRLAFLERRPQPAPPASAVLVAPPVPPPGKVPPPPARRSINIEDVFAGRALAWIGGAATLLGIVLLLVMAAVRGWIDEETRVLMAAAASLGLFAAGGRLYERRGRTDAAAAMAAVGVLGLDAVLVAAAPVYHLLAPGPALAVALGIAAVATALCLRWQAQSVARATMLGALAAPLAVGAAGEPGAVAFLAVAYGAAAAVCVRRDWGWLGVAAFAVVTPQWAGILAYAEGVSTAAQLSGLAVFALLGIAVAAGLELRERHAQARRASVFLLALNAISVAAAGYAILGGETLANGWIAVVAVAHLAAGLLALPDRVGAQLRLTALTLGVLIGDIAAAAIFDGGWLVGAWAASMLLFAVLSRHRPGVLTEGGLALHTSLAVGHVLLLDARESDLGGLALLALVAASCLVSAQINRATLRVALQAVALGLVAYGTALTADGAALAVAFAAEAVTLGRLARRDDAHAASAAAAAFLALGLGQALVVTGGLHALVEGLGHPLAGAGALGASGAAAALLARTLPERLAGLPVRAMMVGVAAVAALYLASVGLVTPFQGGAGGGLLSVRQQGQVLLSAFWALAGVAALLAGLRRNARPWRLAGLALLALAAGKVVMYDLAELTEAYRVMSCIVLGLLLLAGAFAWQRLRPHALRDLRTMPDALR